MHVLNMGQFPNRDSIEKVLRDCQTRVPIPRLMPASKRGSVHVLAFEPSTRTRISFQTAARNLGLEVESVAGAEATSLVKKEPLSDALLTHAIYGADIICVRTPYEGGPLFAAEWLQQVPFLKKIGQKTTIMNMGDGTNEHPTQCFLDLLTIQERLGRLDDFTIGIVGDLKYGRTSHSLVRALSHFNNIRFALISPDEARMPQQFLHGLNIIYQGDDMRQLNQCDVIYATRPQLERIKDQIERQRLEWFLRITMEVLSRLKPDVHILHPRPSVHEIDPAIKLDPHFAADDQTYNGLKSRMYWILQALEDFTELTWEVPFAQPILDSQTSGADASEKRGKYFRPITGDEVGVVIDHLPVTVKRGVLDMLAYYGCLTDVVKTTTDPVNTSRLPEEYDGKKAVILLRNRVISDDVVAQICYAVPTASVGLFRGDGNRCKVTTCAVPPMVYFFKCPNSDCITNNDLNAKSRFYTRDNGNALSCRYCQTTFDRKRVIRFAA